MFVYKVLSGSQKIGTLEVGQLSNFILKLQYFL